MADAPKETGDGSPSSEPPFPSNEAVDGAISRPPLPKAFGSFEWTDEERRSWTSAVGLSIALYGLAIAGIALLGAVEKRLIEHEPVGELTFVEKVIQPPPPPPPPPIVMPKPVEAKPVVPAAAAPVIRPEQKVRKLEKPPPPKQLVAPREMPKEKPKEADPSEDKGIAVFGEPGKGDPAGLESGVAKGGVVGGQVGGAIDLPDGATPPIPSKRNERPPYPDRARRRGLSDTVTLRVVILADGTVTNISVVEGEELFVEEAVKAVKRWKYEPARFKGQPIAVYRMLRIQFSLRG
jgi:periplasmic protein TonB